MAHNLNRRWIISCSTLVCSVIVAFMVGYWFHKFAVIDRDVGVVDYASLKDSPDFKFPGVTLCLKDPFINRKLKEIHPKITRQSYRQYLKGRHFEREFQEVNYSDVTVDLNKYFLFATESWLNESSIGNSSLSFNHVEIFNGFQYEAFLKCFFIDFDIENHRHIKGIKFYYDKNKLAEDWQDESELKLTIFWMIHYPDQFFLGGEFFSGDQKYHNSLSVGVKEYEILKRRNKKGHRCSEIKDGYDNMVLEEHVSRKGCLAPYLKDHMFYPRCNDSKKIWNSRMEVSASEKMDMPKACQRISRITVKNLYRANVRQRPIWYFQIRYPKEVKIITQSKDVDIHTLIGNVGGYIGLFLGNEKERTKNIFLV